MVKDADRKKAYHPRAPHKKDCLCSPCKAKRGTPPPAPAEEIKATPESMAPAPPAEVRLDSLIPKNRFELGGQEHMVKEGVEGMVVVCNLVTSEIATLAGFTIVRPL
ncbi:MAG: hypothetical protein U1B77_02440 [Dehalococcoidales bacterium]|nr:hypothetical protein [Dehalococcoidales bacterium]